MAALLERARSLGKRLRAAKRDGGVHGTHPPASPSDPRLASGPGQSPHPPALLRTAGSCKCLVSTLAALAWQPSDKREAQLEVCTYVEVIQTASMLPALKSKEEPVESISSCVHSKACLRGGGNQSKSYIWCKRCHARWESPLTAGAVKKQLAESHNTRQANTGPLVSKQTTGYSTEQRGEVHDDRDVPQDGARAGQDGSNSTATAARVGGTEKDPPAQKGAARQAAGAGTEEDGQSGRGNEKRAQATEASTEGEPRAAGSHAAKPDEEARGSSDEGSPHSTSSSIHNTNGTMRMQSAGRNPDSEEGWSSQRNAVLEVRSTAMPALPVATPGRGEERGLHRQYGKHTITVHCSSPSICTRSKEEIQESEEARGRRSPSPGSDRGKRWGVLEEGTL